MWLLLGAAVPFRLGHFFIYIFFCLRIYLFAYLFNYLFIYLYIAIDSIDIAPIFLLMLLAQAVTVAIPTIELP